MILRLLLALVATAVIWVLLLRHVIRWLLRSYLRQAIMWSVCCALAITNVVLDPGWILAWLEFPLFGCLAVMDFYFWRKRMPGPDLSSKSPFVNRWLL